MVLKRHIVFVIAVVLLSAAVIIAAGYTGAKVECPTSVQVTSSERALIAVQDNCHFKVTAGQTESGKIRVTNNMNVPISLKALFGRSDIDVRFTEPRGIWIRKGQTAYPEIQISAAEEAEGGRRRIDVTYLADWDGGNASINGSILVEVMEPVTEPEVLIDTSDEQEPGEDGTDVTGVETLPQEEETRSDEVETDVLKDKTEEAVGDVGVSDKDVSVPDRDMDTPDEHISVPEENGGVTDDESAGKGNESNTELERSEPLEDGAGGVDVNGGGNAIE